MCSWYIGASEKAYPRNHTKRYESKVVRSARAHEFERAEVFEESSHALGRVLRRDIVSGDDLFDYLGERPVLFKAAPDDKRCLVQLKILLRIQVNEDSLARVELRQDHVLVRHQFKRAHLNRHSSIIAKLHGLHNRQRASAANGLRVPRHFTEA